MNVAEHLAVDINIPCSDIKIKSLVLLTAFLTSNELVANYLKQVRKNSIFTVITVLDIPKQMSVPLIYS